MCGRYTVKQVEEVVDLLVQPSSKIVRRLNICPGTRVPVIRRHDEGSNELVDCLWKLIPPWADDPKKVPSTINARSETVREKPSFRNAWKKAQRCLIPATGWFEFPPGLRGRKQPVWFSQPEESPFCFAGIWERWRKPDSEEVIDSVAILTCEPNEIVARHHDRMPVMVAREHYGDWLSKETDRVYDLLSPSRQTLPLQVWPVTPLVGRVDYQASDATTPIKVETDPQMDLFSS